MTKVKVIAAYLPQYHVIPENSKWWGEGYTDWVAVKKSKPLFQGHDQPRIPLNNNYYSLDEINSIRWQVDLANKYGVYGFGIYHYWFSDNQNLLSRPSELILANKDININFCFVWDNHSWVSNTWKNIQFANQWAPQFENKNDSGILAELKYGDEKSWKKHYDYLRPFFKDKRYIKIDEKPVFGIFAAENDHDTLMQMCRYFQKLAIDDGFQGIVFLSTSSYKKITIDREFRYEPFSVITIFDRIRRKLKSRKEIKMYNYDQIWKKILFNASVYKNKNAIYGGFVRYDDTPRRGNKANIIKGESSEKFYKYFSKLIRLSRKQGKEYIYLTAWNEWGEGAYLEPDTRSGYGYLEALKKAIDENAN